MAKRALAIVAVVVLTGLTPYVLSSDGTSAFLAVGQGESIWVSDDSGLGLLVDGGSRGMGGRVLGAMADCESVDVVVRPHGHEDHTSSQINVLLTGHAEEGAEVLKVGSAGRARPLRMRSWTPRDPRWRRSR